MNWHFQTLATSCSRCLKSKNLILKKNFSEEIADTTLPSFDILESQALWK